MVFWKIFSKTGLHWLGLLPTGLPCLGNRPLWFINSFINSFILFLQIFKIPSKPSKPYELGTWSFEGMFTSLHMPHNMCHMSHVTCRMSHVTCHVSFVTCPMSHVTCSMQHYVYFFYLEKNWTKWWSWLVKGLLSTRPSLSSLYINIKAQKAQKFSTS